MASTGSLAPVPQAAPAEAAFESDVPTRRSGPPRQTLLFQERPAGNVIPFEAGGIAVEAPVRARATRGGARAPQRRAPAPDDAQPKFDFLPPAPPATRKLSTAVEAAVYCDAPVATPIHRALAGAIDASMILIAFGLFQATLHVLGANFASNKTMLLVSAASAALITMFYGFIWVWRGGNTAGMRATGLTLVAFDGNPAQRMARWWRYAGACLSYCAGGLGILWALVDEESLSWHDHISQTFPTFQRPETNFVQWRG
jgi:uncharacterized RDD family membrane protein YckC